MSFHNLHLFLRSAYYDYIIPVFGGRLNMGKYVLEGGKKISGEIDVNGAKNAVLPVLAATILNEGLSVIHNCPKISDLFLTNEILLELGCSVKWEGKTIIVDSKDISSCTVNEELVKKMRSSIIFLGALLGRMKQVKIPYPGGCQIGARPIDLHLKAIKKMGAFIYEEGGYINCTAKKLHGAKINLDFPSVGATENIMLAAVKASGRTIIYNAAREPEIVALQSFLNLMGAEVRGAGTETVIIDGVKNLYDTEYSVLPDRIEAGTFLTAAAITGGEVYLNNAKADIMRQTLLRLSETGCSILEEKNGIYLKAPKALRHVDIIRTQPYPGFPTDMQPQFMSLLTLAKGTSIIIETVFESRFKHVNELLKMGADISIEGRTSVIRGVNSLKGSHVYATDLRSGAALILAGLAAEGETVVYNSGYVERGYENIEEVLKSLGASINLFKDN